MLYKILYALDDRKTNSNLSKRGNKTLKNISSGLAKGGGKKTKKNKVSSNSKNKKSKTNYEKKYRQQQTKNRRNNWKTNTQ